MLFHITFRGNGKQNLLAHLLILVTLSQTSLGQTTTFTNNSGAGGDIWNDGANWDIGLPGASSSAVIPAGVTNAGGNLFITNTGTFNTALARALYFNAPSSQYVRIRPSNELSINSQLTFGNSSNSGTFNYSTGVNGNVLVVGDLFGTDGTLTLNVPKGLAVSVDAAAELRLSTPIISGSGSLNIGTVSYSRNSSTGEDARVNLRNLFSGLAPASYSTYGGTTVVNPGILLEVGASSTADSSGILRGPFGLATLTLNAGTLSTFALDGGVDNQGIELHNPIDVVQNSLIKNHATLDLHGAMRTNGNNLDLTLKYDLTFDNNNWSASDTGTLTILDVSKTTTYIKVDSGTSTYGGYWNSGSGSGLQGTVAKTGAGAYEARRLRVESLDIQAGVLRILDSGTNSGLSTSHVNNLTIDSTGILDLRDNDLVIDYSGSSPIGTPAYNDAGTIAKYVRDGFGGGTWNGSSGLKTSVSAATFSAIGFAEAGSLSISSWQGVAVDTTTVLVRYTFQGDSNVDGTVNITDFALLASNFNTSQTWYGGDYNYDGTTNISDFQLLTVNFNVTGRRGGTGLSGLAELYVELLDYPVIYWEARMRPDIWWRFEEFDSMNLGQIPALPEGMRAVPEPAAGLVLAATVLLRRRHR